MQKIKIQMFGKLSLSSAENQISFSDNRSKKMWIILAYFLCHRDHIFTRTELIELFWNDDVSVSNPENALKTTFHRIRALLDHLYPSAGHELIVWQKGCYSWNNNIDISIDADTFDYLCKKEYSNNKERLEGYLEALSLYKGDFLSTIASENWVIPVNTYFHKLYIQTVLDTVPLLSEEKRYKEAADICRTALKVEPYSEPLHQSLMSSLINMGDNKGAASVYEELSNQLFSDLGIKPSKETRDLYRTATRSVSDRSIPMDDVLEYLKETDAEEGALFCEYDYFKILCHVEARSMKRNGKSTHVALLSVSEAFGSPLSKRSMNTAMEHLHKEIGSSLRRGDAFSRCSISQFVVLLPQANYENSCMVCQRIIRAFFRQHPHSPAKIQYAVQPLSPEAVDF